MPEGHARAAHEARPTAPLGQSAFPLQVPQGIRPPHCTRCGPCGLGAPGGGLAAQLLPFRRPRRVVTSRCSVICLAIGQSPTEPSWWRRAVSRLPHPGIPSTPCRRSGRLRGGRRPLRAPRWRDRSLQACTESRVVVVFRIRYCKEALRFPGGGCPAGEPAQALGALRTSRSGPQPLRPARVSP